MKIIDGIPVFGEPDLGALTQIKVCQKTADKVALMGDNHKGYSVPIGGVVAHENGINISGIGFDIACGNKSVLLDVKAEDIKKNISKIMDDIFNHLSFGVGLSRQRDSFRSPYDNPIFEDPAWSMKAISSLKDKARNQCGTIGSGNHYVDIFEDEIGRIWIGVHFGSRGLGHKTATYFLKEAGAKDGMDVEPCIIPVNTSLGEDYLECMRLCGLYAYAGRDWVCSRVANLIGANIIEEVHNNHNFAWREEHEGKKYWVARKGATPAFPGLRSFIGGSMGDISVIVEGVEDEESKYALYSTIHGAGRVMSRTEAAGRRKWRKKGRDYPEGKISRQMMNDWIKPMGIELRGAGTDESPHCYKRLPEVIKAQGNTIKVIHTLHPLGVAMAGEDVIDPFKD